MNLLLRILKYLVGLVVVLLAAGFLLPANYSAQRSATINAPADKIWPLVSSAKAWAKWGVWYARDPAMQVTYTGPDNAVGAKWSWKSKSEGNGAIEFTKLDPNKAVAYSFQMEGMSASPGDMQLTPEGNATKVTWTMRGDAGLNPLYRWFGYFMDRLVGPDFEAGLKNLKKLAEAA